MIDPSARIHPDAVLGIDVKVGPWTSIGPQVEIADGCEIGAHCVIKGPTRIGANTRIFPFCSIGDDPQDKKFVPGTPTRLEIGSGNTIREYCSLNRGSPAGGGLTSVGNDNWLMAYCHIAHDCHVGNHTIFANNATLAGHVEVGDFAILAGFVGVHQFCRVGESSFCAIAAVVVKDVPPYVIVEGNTAVGVRMAEAICKRLRFSNEDTEQILALVDNHMKFGAVEEMRASTLKKFVRLPHFEEHLALHRLDCLSSHRHLDSYEFVRQFLEATPPEEVRPARLLTGDDLQAMGVL